MMDKMEWILGEVTEIHALDEAGRKEFSRLFEAALLDQRVVQRLIEKLEPAVEKDKTEEYETGFEAGREEGKRDALRLLKKSIKD